MIKLHLGCGWRDFGEEWIHIDGGGYKHLKYHSITDLSQFKDNSVEVIYASHILEYFDRFEVVDVIEEWKRILKPNGKLRLAVPNFEVLCDLYREGTIDLKQILGPLYGRMQMGDEVVYHRTTYDFESLKILLETSGFKEINLYNWRDTDHSQFDDHSQAYIPHMDKDSGTLISLNIECIK